MKKKRLLKERFQQLAGLKEIKILNEEIHRPNELAADLEKWIGNFKAIPFGSGQVNSVRITDPSDNTGNRDILRIDGNEKNAYYVIWPGKDFPKDPALDSYFTSTPDDTYNRPHEKIKAKNAFVLVGPKVQKILSHVSALLGTPEEEEEEPRAAWCKRNLNSDWYFDKLMNGLGYLKVGDCGDAVEIAQEHMNEFLQKDSGNSANIVPLNVDGKYGPKTKAEVQRVQKAINTKPDGYYGKKTHDALIKLIKSMTTVVNEPEVIDKMDIRDPDNVLGKNEPEPIKLQTLAPVTAADDAEFKEKTRKKLFKRKNKKSKKSKSTPIYDIPKMKNKTYGL